MKEKVLLKRFSREAFEQGLVWGKSGNISVRLSKKQFLITASGSSLKDITDRDIIPCAIDNDGIPKRASMEWRLHKEIYRVRTDVNAILHSQPLFSTFIACVKNKDINSALIPEGILYINKIEAVEYCQPGSKELSKKAAEKARDVDIILLRNHGVVALSESLEDVINKTAAFEFICKLHALSYASKKPLTPISSLKAKELLKMLAKRKRV